MIDIVERLRAAMRDRFYELPKISRTCEDAANEIERLRAELKRANYEVSRSSYHSD